MTAPAPATTPRAVAGHSLALIATEAATRATSFVAVAYLSRTLAPAGMGAVEFGMSVFGLVVVIGTGGIDTVLTPMAARQPGDVRRLAGRALVVAWIQLALALVLVLGAAALFEVAPELRTSMPWFAAAAVLAPAGMRFAFVAGERAWIGGLTNVLGALAFLALCRLGVHDAGDAARVGAAWLAATALRVAVAFAVFRRRHGAPVFVTDATGAWLRRAATVGVGSLAASLMINADVIVLGFVRPAGEVASYGLATKVPLFLASLAALFYTALFPTVVRAVAGGEAARLGRIVGTTVALALAVGVPGAVALGFGAAPLLVLLFGDAYRGAGPVLALLAWRIPLAAVLGAFQGVVWATSPERDARLAVLTCAAMLVPLPLAAAYAGSLGVAACVVLGSAVGVVLYRRDTGIDAVGGAPACAWSAAGGLVTAACWLVVAPAGVVAATATMLAAWAAGSGLALWPLLPRLRAL